MRPCRLVLLATLFAVVAPAQEWTRFRGPNGTGTGQGATIPLTWTEKDFAWKVPLPGVGHSSPVVWGDKVFATSGEKSGTRHVACINTADGAILWKKEFAAKGYKLHPRNSVGTATPTVDAERLYLTWGTPTECVVQALDHTGREVWRTGLGPYPSQHGFGSSPILHEDLVIVYYQPDGPGALVALDAKTGEVRWKLARQGKNATYSTPCIFQPVGMPASVICTNWQHGVSGVDVKTGKLLWELPVFDRSTSERAIASPVIAGDLVLGVSGFISGLKHLVAVRPGDGEKAKEVWRLEKGVPQMATPLVVGERIYLLTEANFATCVNRSDGKVLWSERLPVAVAGSPILVGQRIYCPGTDGTVLVLGTGEKFEILGRSPLGEATQATPAVAGGRIFFRTEGHLIAIGTPK